MKKIGIVLLTLLTCPFIDGCDKNNEKVDKSDYLLNEDYNNLKSLSDLDALDTVAYDDSFFGTFDNPIYQEFYYDNVLSERRSFMSLDDSVDPKYLYYSRDQVRFVNLSDGYALSLNSKTTCNADFSISNYRSKIYNEDFTLTVSHETSNPYSSWATYRDEWLIRYINNEDYLDDNDMEYSHPTIYEKNTIRDDSMTSVFSIVINEQGNIRKNYYNIAIVRPFTDISGKDFYLFVFKSTTDLYDDFIDMIKSFDREIEGVAGTSAIHYDGNTPIYNENWSEETKNYYTKLYTEQRTNWGIYTGNVGTDDATLRMKQQSYSKAFDYDFDILPYYQHTSFGGSMASFPVASALKYAGGNGENGDPVIQVSYQFTNNNNKVTGSNTTENYVPMFDILRGEDDETGIDRKFSMRDKTYDTLVSLANAFKEYEKPILFRLNNEMNSDWTSYCGLITLLDPDLFAASWRYLYKLFEDNGVNNCIWIFNPILVTCPYCSWGEDMCFFPGFEYVQVLGITHYTDNNDGKANVTTFKKEYTKYYNKNYQVWRNYPWSISEFGCGSGGESTGTRYRYSSSQASYVRGMFEDFNDRENNEYLQNIKVAIWFSCNDYTTDGDVSNQYEIVIDKNTETVEEFKIGLAANKIK